MTMDVPEEALATAVGHTHRSADPQSEEAAVHLQADVFACTKGAADPTENQPHVFFVESQTSRNLVSIFMQPLRGDMQFNAFTT
jgi:hypothetical protein